ncbi:MAG: adenylate/guanylate cyclase domain-containing protein [Candidatus Nanopelagicales bacterium]
MANDELETVVLGGAERYTREEMADASRMSLTEVGRLWRAMGFPDVGEARAFTDADLNALLRVAALLERGMIDMDGIVEVARSMGQTTARLAEWQVETLGRKIAGNGELGWQDDATSELTEDMSDLLPELEILLGYVWRRQLAATVGRYLDQPGDDDNEALATVGFADLVSFTRLTRQLDSSQLATLVQAFESLSADIVHGESARLVKTLGDEVMFVADTPDHAARIALSLHRIPEGVEQMPQLRIGMATGTVLNRMGDVFGTTVNRASRMTAIARPGTTVVDSTTSEALHDSSGYDRAYATRSLTPRPVRGLGIVRPYALMGLE